MSIEHEFPVVKEFFLKYKFLTFCFLIVTFSYMSIYNIYRYFQCHLIRPNEFKSIDIIYFMMTMNYFYYD